jgi:hypothetical protein
MKDPAWESRLNDLMNRISRDQDRKAFEGWTFKEAPPMPDPFDPAEFDAPSLRSRRGLSHPARRHAKGRGRRVAQQVAALSRQIEQDARQRAEWTAQAGAGSMPPPGRWGASADQRRVWWDRLKDGSPPP